MATKLAALVGAFLSLAVACGLLEPAHEANAQPHRAGSSPRQANAAAEAWRDCERAREPAPPPAIAAAVALLGERWSRTERGFFAAYTMAGEVRNPFDLSPKTPGSGPRDGIVQARPPRCTWRAAEASPALLVRFTTPFYRFHEAGPGWSPPLRNGLMLEAVVEPTGETWQVRDAGSEQVILLPEQKPRAANPSALPPEVPWAEPMPGCARRTKWNGEACVPRKR